jgi:Ca2+-transporting ATPase
MDDSAWYALSAEQCFARLQSSAAGITAPEAAARLARDGPNELQAERRAPAWRMLFAQFANVLIVILLIAAALSAALGHTLEALVIAVIVCFAVLLGFAQEYRAERALEALRRMAAPTSCVVRDGEEQRVAARDVVAGDVVVLRTGDRVAADARVLESINLQLDEAALTGESLPVAKHALPLPAQPAEAVLAVGDRGNMVHAGTAVVYGRGYALVVATGMRTEFGRIAGMLHQVEAAPTPLQRDLDRLGRQLGRAALAVVAVIVGLGLLRGQPLVEMLIFGIALAVAVVPEALPAVVTVSLAIGVQRMVRRHALIRRLPAVEALGCTSVICSDKTGTLTRDEMTVRKILVAGRVIEVSGAGYAPRGEFGCTRGPGGELPEPLIELLRAAALASDARLLRDASAPDGGWRVEGDPTEGALLVAAAKAGLRKDALELAAPRVHEIPFTAESRCMTTVHRGPRGLFACAKGAPEALLERCTRRRGEHGSVALDEAGRSGILAAAHELASAALRVLAVAAREDASTEGADSGLTFLGLVGMSDPPRPEAYDAIATCVRAGIRPVMITGDHPITAEAVARELGLLNGGKVLTGAALESMSDEELCATVDAVSVYARVSPAHKLRVVAAWQARGHVVAMTGDGVNDAPALKRADIGVAMGITGTDVSREVAAMTLTDDNFASIVAAVEEGRAVYLNIKKYLMYLLSSNIGEIGLMAGAALLGLPLPLAAVQILYVNLATDGLPALALAVDPQESDLMRRPPRDPRAGIFGGAVLALMLAGGLWSMLVNLGLFAWALNEDHGQARAMTMCFVSLVLIQFFKAYSFRSERHSVFRAPFANRWLNRAVAWEVALLVAIVCVPSLRDAFRATALSPADWALAAAVAATVVPVLEFVKWLERRLRPEQALR